MLTLAVGIRTDLRKEITEDGASVSAARLLTVVSKGEHPSMVDFAPPFNGKIRGTWYAGVDETIPESKEGVRESQRGVSLEARPVDQEFSFCHFPVHGRVKE